MPNPNQKTIGDVFGYDLSVTASGYHLMYYCNQAVPLDFYTANIAHRMDQDYFMGHAYDKPISRMVEILLKQQNIEKADTTTYTILGNMIGERFGMKWNKIYDALTTEYEMLENYNRIETEETDKTNTGTDTHVVDGETLNTKNLTTAHTGTDNTTTSTTESETEAIDTTTTNDTTTTDAGTISETKQNTGTQGRVGTEDVSEAHNQYAFNSGAGVPESTDTTDRDTSETRTDNLTETHSGTDGNTNIVDGETTEDTDRTRSSTGSKTDQRTLNLSDAQTGTDRTENDTTDTRTLNLAESIDRELRVHGNIGVMSNEQMQEAFIEIYQKWGDFWRIIFEDIDTVLCARVQTF